MSLREIFKLLKNFRNNDHVKLFCEGGIWNEVTILKKSQNANFLKAQVPGLRKNKCEVPELRRNFSHPRGIEHSQWGGDL